MGARNEIETAVRKNILAWEDGDEGLPSDCARKIVRVVLGHERLIEAMIEPGHLGGEIERLGRKRLQLGKCDL